MATSASEPVSSVRIFLATPPLGVPPLSAGAAAAWADAQAQVPVAHRVPRLADADAVLAPAGWAARFLPGRQKAAPDAWPVACLVLADPDASEPAVEAWTWLARGADHCWLTPPRFEELAALITHLASPVIDGAIRHREPEAAMQIVRAFCPRGCHPRRRAMATILNDAVNTRDGYTAGHNRRVGWLACLVGIALGYPRRALERLTLAATLHDVGKLGIADAILRSTQRLTEGERAEIETHPQLGADLVQRHQALFDLAPAILGHHEAWDGTGYPFRVPGPQIPRDARIIGIVDAFDAITRDRPYRAGRPVAVAVAELQRTAGAQFDPALVDTFLALVQRGIVPPEPQRLARLVEERWNVVAL